MTWTSSLTRYINIYSWFPLPRFSSAFFLFSLITSSDFPHLIPGNIQRDEETKLWFLQPFYHQRGKKKSHLFPWELSIDTVLEKETNHPVVYLLLHRFIFEDETFPKALIQQNHQSLRMSKEPLKQMKQLRCRAAVLGPKWPKRPLKKYSKNILLPGDYNEFFCVGTRSKRLMSKGYDPSQLWVSHSF